MELCDLAYGLSWGVLHVCWSRSCGLLPSSGGGLCRCWWVSCFRVWLGFVLCVVDLLSTCSAHCWKWGVEGSNDCRMSPFIFVCLCFLDFGALLLRCTYVYSCYLFLMDWSFCGYQVSPFISGNTLASKSVFSNISVGTFSFPVFAFAWYLLHPFVFSLSYLWIHTVSPLAAWSWIVVCCF